MTTHMRATLGIIVSAALVGGAFARSAATARWVGLGTDQQNAASPQANGQTATPLGDGRWLLVGGEGRTDATGSVAIFDPQSGVTTALGALTVARAWHTSTVLSDGRVLIVGGRNTTGIVETPEILDPGTGVSTLLAMPGAMGRSTHTATLLTDGQVLIAGGTNGGPSTLQTEVWDVQAQLVTPMPQAVIRRTGHMATLLPDGRVLFAGGRTIDGASASGADALDPNTARVVRGDAPLTETSRPVVAESIPANGAGEVPLDVHVALRFSTPVRFNTFTADTVALSGRDGPIAIRVIVAENGRLAFVWPMTALADDTTYVLSVSGTTDWIGIPIVPASITFTTRRNPRQSSDRADTEEWVPNEGSIKNGWRSDRPASPWESTPPLVAPAGVTAISGRVLTLDGRPLPDVTLAIEGDDTTRTDRTGRFLLVIRPDGPSRRVLQIDGGTASRPDRRYGFFEYGATVTPGQTAILPFTSWMPKLDTSHAVTIPSPTTSEVVVTTLYIPGLELHIPPQTIIRGRDGKAVTQVSITPIPVDRPPFPLAKNVVVPVYFTVQPGSAYVQTDGTGPKGAWLVYPNYGHDRPGQRLQFYHYDPDEKGWYVYGMGTVTADGVHVQPDPKTRIYELTGAMINDGSPTPGANPTPFGPTDGDPVDPSTGIFVMHKTDLYLPDVIPLAFTRTYNSRDGYNRPFGTSMTHSYAMFLHSELQYQQVDLILPEGGTIHYVRTSPGTGFVDAVFTHVERPNDSPPTSATPSPFYKSTIAWNGNGWDLKLQDGTVYVFGDTAPLQAIRDRYGNTVTVTHANGQTGNVTRVTSPNGRWISLTYDSNNRIAQINDNIGRSVSYTYDANWNLSTVTDPESNVTTYTYTAANEMATIKDGRNTVYLTNEYTSGRVTRQTLADPTATYQFAYTVDGSGNVTQTDITNPRGYVRRLVFNSDHYVTSDTQAYGTSLARTTTAERQSGSNLVTATVDGLSRRTEYTYDSAGHVLTIIRLAGTADWVRTTFTYEPQFNQVATVTDPLNHTWTMGYDALGRLTSMTDPLTHATTLTPNAAGQVTGTTDALQHTWQFAYSGGDLISVTDPLGAVRRRFVDGVGRLIAVTDPLGRQTRRTPDKLNRVTTVTDALGGQTSFAYDPNSNLLSVTDALTHPTGYTYDTSDRVATRTDPLQKAESFQYDKNHTLTQATDRKNQITTYQYDALDRISQVTFADTSTVQYTYDVGDRVTQIVDSANGTITRQYDGLNRLTQETTAQGTVSYTYDADNRRATMTVAGQPQVSYGYDVANRLTSITQGSNVVSLTYDNANRRSTLTYPNGVLATYGYDNANHLTSVTYTLNSSLVGDLSYSYDLAGNKTSVGGSFARTGLPQAVNGATYDSGNRLATWSTQIFSFDANGNLGSDGLTSYTWDARNHLSALTGGVSASFSYDAMGRRRNKTINASAMSFLYDGVNLVQELTSGTPTANVITGLSVDEGFTRTDATGTTTLLVDALGSTIELAAASGALLTHYTFEPFGVTTMSGSTSANATQFTGRESDGAGLYFYRERYYNPSLQRFLSEDPAGFVGGLNTFAYAADAPTVSVDPMGLKPCPAFSGRNCQPPRIGAPRGPRMGAPPVPRMGAAPIPNVRPDPRRPLMGPGPHCDAFCRMISDAARRAGPMADPWSYVELEVGSVVGGTAPIWGPVAGGAVTDAVIAGSNAAVDLEVTLPGAINAGSDFVSGALVPGPPPASIPGVIGGVIGRIF